VRIVMVGAGEVGYAVAGALSSEGHDLVVVEEDEERAAKAEAELDVMVIRGSGARPHVLEEAGVVEGGRVDLFIACTNRDEVNLLACWIARRQGVLRTIARAVGMEFTDTDVWAKSLGIERMISPERAVARQIEELLEVRSASYAAELAPDRAGIYSFRIAPDSPALGIPLRDLRIRHPELVTILLHVRRGSSGFIPKASDHLEAGDEVAAVCYREQLPRFEEFFRPRSGRPLRRVLIVGGGKVGYQTALRIAERVRGVDVRLIDQDRGKCERLARELAAATVLWGDGGDEEFLRSEGIAEADGFVACTESDERNLVFASLAKVLGAEKAIAVVRRRGYLRLAGPLPCDAVINRNQALSEGILRSVRYPGGSRTLAVLDAIGAETLEVVLPEESPALGIPLKDLPLPEGVILGLMQREGELQIPTGTTLFRAGDTVAVFAASELMPEAMRVLGVSP